MSIEKFMKRLNHLARYGLLLVAVAIATLVLAGCETTTPADPDPHGDAPYTAFQPGEALIITFADTVTQLQPFEGRVKEDGTITLMENQEFKAAGKTAGQLEKEVRERYVPRYFVKMTVTVKSMDRFFYVNGQVRMPGRYEYRGDITVSGAVAAAGGCTEFANKTKVKISRANNKTVVVNLEKAIDDPKLDLPIYPRDRIEVPRKKW
jgi:protein involved in polysaccharide export with SLBB domain